MGRFDGFKGEDVVGGDGDFLKSPSVRGYVVVVVVVVDLMSVLPSHPQSIISIGHIYQFANLSLYSNLVS